VFLKNLIPERVKPYEEVKEEVREAYIEKLRSEKLREYAKQIKEKILRGEETGIKPIRFENYPLEQLSQALLISAEDMDNLVFGKEKVFGPYKVLDGVAILVIEERKERNLTPEEVEELKKALRDAKLQDLQGIYVDKLIKAYSVKVNEELMQ